MRHGVCWLFGMLFLSIGTSATDAEDISLRLIDDTNLSPNISYNGMAGADFQHPQRRVLVEHRGRIYAVGRTPATGWEIFSAQDGQARAQIALDLTPGPTSSRLDMLTGSAGPLYFVAGSALDEQLWSLQEDGSHQQITQFENGLHPRFQTVASAGETVVFDAEQRLWGRVVGEPPTPLSAADGTIRPETVHSIGSAVIYARSSLSPESRLEIWQTQGTPESTKLLASFPSLEGSEHLIARVDGGQYWLLASQCPNQRLFVSDGTASGTLLVKNNVQEGTCGTSSSLSVLGGVAYFTDSHPVDSPGTSRIWRSEGSAATTSVFASIPRPASTSAFFGLTAVTGGVVFLTAESEAWFATLDIVQPILLDGSPIAINANSAFSHGAEFPRANGVAFAPHVQAEQSSYLLRAQSDGAEQLPPGASIDFAITTNLGSRLVAANRGTSPFDLWISDGTLAGTQSWADIWNGTSSTFRPDAAHASEGVAAWAGNRFYMITGPFNCDPFTTSCPTTVVETDIDLRTSRVLADPARTDIHEIASLSDRIVYSLYVPESPSTGSWQLRHVMPGLSKIEIASRQLEHPGPLASVVNRSTPFVLYTCNGDASFDASLCAWSPAVGERIVVDRVSGTFEAFEPLGEIDGIGLFFILSPPSDNLPIRLWRTDGTPSGTYPISTIEKCPALSHPSGLASATAQVGSRLAFCAVHNNQTGLWVSDGSDTGTYQLQPTGVLDHFVTDGVRVFFRNTDQSNSEVTIWRSDLTAIGTVPIQPPGFLSGPAIIGDMVHFTDAERYWVGDGSAGGAVAVAETYAGQPYPVPAAVSAGSDFGPRAVFNCTTSDHTNELCSIDADGTSIVQMDSYPGQPGSDPRVAGISGPYLLIDLEDGMHGRELHQIVANRIFTDGFD